MRPAIRVYAICATAATVSGCAIPQHVRDDSRVIGLYVQAVKKDLEEFSTLRNYAVKARVANLAALELKTLRAEQANARDLQLLEIIQDDERTKLLTALRNAASLILVQRSEYDNKSSSARKDVANAKSALNLQLSKLSDTAAILLKLSENRPTTDEMQFYIDFLKQVREHIEKDLKADAKVATADSVTRIEQKAK